MQTPALIYSNDGTPPIGVHPAISNFPLLTQFSTRKKSHQHHFLCIFLRFIFKGLLRLMQLRTTIKLKKKVIQLMTLQIPGVFFFFFFFFRHYLSLSRQIILYHDRIPLLRTQLCRARLRPVVHAWPSLSRAPGLVCHARMASSIMTNHYATLSCVPAFAHLALSCAAELSVVTNSIAT